MSSKPPDPSSPESGKRTWLSQTFKLKLLSENKLIGSLLRFSPKLSLSLFGRATLLRTVMVMGVVAGVGGVALSATELAGGNVLDVDPQVIVFAPDQPNVFDRLEQDHADLAQAVAANNGLLLSFFAKLDAVQLQQGTIINMIRIVQMQIDAGFSSPHPHGPPDKLLPQILEEVEEIGCAVFPGKADCELLPESVTE